MNKKTKKLMTSIMFPLIALVIEYLINLCITPYITDTIGTESYGFVSLAKNFASYALIITTALNSYAARFISIEYHKKKYKDANIYYSSVFFGDVILGGIIFLVASVCIFNLDKLLNIPNNIVQDIKLLFFVIFINFFLSTISTAFGSSSLIANKVDLNGIFKTIAYAVEAVFLIAVYKFFEPMVCYVGLGILIATMIVSVGDLSIQKKYVPELHIEKKYCSFKAIKELVVNGIWNSINALGNTLNSGLDLIITNLLLNNLQMGQLSIANVINTILGCLYQLLSRPFYPLFLKDYAQQNIKQLLKDMKLAMKFCGFVTALAVSGFFGLGLLYYKLWIPNQDINLIYKITVIVLLVGVTQGVVYPLYYIYTLTVKNKVPCIITIIGGILNVTGMYVLIKNTSLGLYAVVLTTVVIMTIINLITNPIYMCKCLNIKITTFYPTILRHIIAFGLMAVVFKWIARFNLTISWISLFIWAFIDCIIGIIIYAIIVLDKSERDYMFNFFRKKVDK